MKESMKDVICNILSECCHTGNASHYFCMVDGVEMPYNKIKGKCPFMNYTDKFGTCIDKPEVIIDGIEVKYCNEVTPEHWKAWIDKYENLI